MAGHTPNLGLWYPDGTDPISAGDDGIRELTTTLDNYKLLGPPPWEVFETATTNQDQDITSTSYAALPNTFDNGSSITFTLERAALLWLTADVRLSTSGMSAGAEGRLAFHLLGTPLPNANVLWVKQWGDGGSAHYIHQSLSIPLLLPAGVDYHLNIRGMRQDTMTYFYANFLKWTMTFIRYAE